jgi:hypothetical protein
LLLDKTLLRLQRAGISDVHIAGYRGSHPIRGKGLNGPISHFCGSWD